MNQTILKFGYPDTLVEEFDHWVLLLRPSQVTAGSLVLAAKHEATAFGDLPASFHAELATITRHIERMLRSAVAYDKVNYLMLMMVDPHVHFHVFPRYDGVRAIGGLTLKDAGWPGPPDLRSGIEITVQQVGDGIAQLRRYLDS